MEQHNGTTYENVWGVTFGDRLEEMREELKEEARKEAREEARAEGIAEGIKEGCIKFQTETIHRMIRLGYDDKTIQAAVGITDVNEIIMMRKNAKTEA